jgi:ribonucleotide reductase alpha subunit
MTRNISNAQAPMRVIKRDGSYEEISFDKVLRRVRTLWSMEPSLSTNISPDEIAQKVCARIYDGVKTSELDELAAQICATMITTHPDYGTLAARIAISNHHKNTSPSFSETIAMLYDTKDVHGNPCKLVSDEIMDVVNLHRDKLNNKINYDRDFCFDYFGFKTLERSYLLKIDKKPVERPQHMWMRVALGIHAYDIKEALETYEYMSQRYFTHATPTLFNAGTPRAQLSSCFLLDVEDSVTGMYKTISDCAQISKYAGGIGIHIHDIRSRGSHIRGTNGNSSGIIPLLRVFNNTARHINQAGKRAGSIAMYLEPWHYDIEGFLDIRKNQGAEEERCRDLFTAMWIPDLFMARVQDNADWSLMCPDECRGLSDVYGDDFKALYEKYESEGRFRKKVKAQTIWYAILKSQIETGTPYLCYKDACNLKSNQSNLGTIKSSNLCAEIIEYSDPEQVASCNLASIGLPAFVKNGVFDYEHLHTIVRIVTRNLNKVIDRTFYPIPEAKNANMLHRPIGIGVQGLADVYALLRLPFESSEAAAVNKKIFEVMYHGALTESMSIARRRATLREQLDNEKITDTTELLDIIKYLNMIPAERVLQKYTGAYATYEGSPISKGILQFDMWQVQPAPFEESGLDWDTLRADIKTWGVRNSLLLANMPTASSSQILGFNECFEPFTSNMFQRQTMAGEFTIINKYLIKDLIEKGLWSLEMKDKILGGGGSIQHIMEIPEDIRALYKTVWEIKQKALIDQAADRGAFICQSQSLNLFMEDTDFNKLTSMHFYAWKKGLKTGVYYLRTRPKARIAAYTLTPVGNNEKTDPQPTEEEKMACRRDNPEGCLMCGA